MGGYRNLEIALKENGVTKRALADLLELRYATVIDKIKGRSRFTCDEAIFIKRTLFPDRLIEDLFFREDPPKKKKKAR